MLRFGWDDTLSVLAPSTRAPKLECWWRGRDIATHIATPAPPARTYATQGQSPCPWQASNTTMNHLHPGGGGGPTTSDDDPLSDDAALLHFEAPPLRSNILKTRRSGSGGHRSREASLTASCHPAIPALPALVWLAARRPHPRPTPHCLPIRLCAGGKLKLPGRDASQRSLAGMVRAGLAEATCVCRGRCSPFWGRAVRSRRHHCRPWLLDGTARVPPSQSRVTLGHLPSSAAVLRTPPCPVPCAV